MDSNLLAEAARRAQGRDPASARPLVVALLARDPGHPDALTLDGIVAQRTGDLAHALDAFARARAADPRNPARLGNEAMALKALGRFDAAIGALRAADALRPGHAVTLTNLAACLIEARRSEEAEAPLRAVLAGKPDHADAWNNLGIVLARARRHDAAVAAYRRALALRPGWPEAQLNLVDALIARGDAAEAEALARAIGAGQPGHPRVANQRAALAMARGDTAEALGLYREALGRAFSHTVAHNLALALLERGEAAEAQAIAERMIADSPSVTTPLALVFAAMRRQGTGAALDALAGLDRFVTVIDRPAPDGFHAALAAEFGAHPSLRYEPEGLVTRAGRQSDDLARERTPALAALAALATEALAAHHAALGRGDHPWLRARPDDWTLTLWGTRLSPGGAVEAHIHAPNWLSGVYYPDLPDAVGSGAEGGLGLGVLPAALGGDGPVRTIEARPGRMILFPSFLWHATMPFAGAADRLSFAFDLVPAGTGRPHSLGV